MSSQYNLIVTNDSRIQDITSKLDVAVRKGASSSTFQRFPASSATASQVQFNVPINSERTIIDRNVTITSTQELQIVVTANTTVADVKSLAFGDTEALQAFPFNSLITNAQVNLNNHSHSVNTQDLMGVLLKTIDNELLEYDCPYLVDGSFKNYSDCVLEKNNPLKNTQSLKGIIPGRGAHRLINWTCVHKSAGNADVLAQKSVYDGGNATVKEAELAKTLTTADPAETFTWVINYTTTEPLLFNPILLYSKDNLNNAGMYNVSQMLMNLSLDSSAKRAFSSASSFPMEVKLLNIYKPELNLNFITPQASSLLSATQVLPFIEHIRMLTNNNASIPSKGDAHLY
jgi:hypothetical protein